MVQGVLKYNFTVRESGFSEFGIKSITSSRSLSSLSKCENFSTAESLFSGHIPKIIISDLVTDVISGFIR